MYQDIVIPILCLEQVSIEKIIMEKKYERGLYPKHNHRICKRAQKLMNMSTQNRSYLSTSEFKEEIILYRI